MNVQRIAAAMNVQGIEAAVNSHASDQRLHMGNVMQMSYL